MLSSMQPSRPKVSPQHPRNPLHQQQTRQHQTSRPSSQIEAMPPHNAPLQPRPAQLNTPMPFPVYDPAKIHPVFFTPWRKAPFPTSSAFSPAATGYVFADMRKRGHSTTKL